MSGTSPYHRRKAREKFREQVRRRFLELRDAEEMSERQAAMLACHEYGAWEAAVGLPYLD